MYSKVTFAVATIAGLAGRSLANPALPNYDGLIDENGCIISAGLCPWVSPKIATRSDSTFDIAAYCQQSPASCVPVVVDESQVKRSPQEASVNMVGYCKEFPENCVPVVIDEDKVKRASWRPTRKSLSMLKPTGIGSLRTAALSTLNLIGGFSFQL